MIALPSMMRSINLLMVAATSGGACIYGAMDCHHLVQVCGAVILGR